MIKAKFGTGVRSKTAAAQVNEALLKILCHNICVLIQSMYELGITPLFTGNGAQNSENGPRRRRPPPPELRRYRTMNVNGNGRYHSNGATAYANGNGAHSNGNGTIELHLKVSDPDLYTALARRDEPGRSQLALAAMKVGLAALRQAQGEVDAHQIRDAGEKVIASMSDALEKHRRDVSAQVSECIREYFDPRGGLFTQRVRTLVGQNGETGELERLIRQQIEGDGSLLAKTLAAHVGHDSPVMRALDPDGGVVASLTRATETTLSEQRERILSEFSLDNQGSALARLVAELTRSHGDVGRALEDRIGSVMGRVLSRQG